MSKFIIMSDERSELTESVKKLGYEIIPSERLDILPFESRHADLQCLRIEDTFFVLQECKRLIAKLRDLGCKVIVTNEEIDGEYPRNVLLNAVYLNKKLYCRADSLASVAKEYCKTNGIELVNVNQGYTKCSTALAGGCFITADKGVFEAMSRNGAEGLLIESGDIRLDGVDYGFIGGCCFYDGGVLYFGGDITKHRNCGIISDFLSRHGTKIKCLTATELYDIGGFIAI